MGCHRRTGSLTWRICVIMFLLASLAGAVHNDSVSHMLDKIFESNPINHFTHDEYIKMSSLQISDLTEGKYMYDDVYYAVDIIEKLLKSVREHTRMKARGLATTEDFAEFNEVLSTLTIQLPEYSGTISGIEINLHDIVCSNVTLDVIELTSSGKVYNDLTESDCVDVRFYIPPGLRGECTFVWTYSVDFPFLGTVSGDGTGTGVMEDGSLDAISTISIPSGTVDMPEVIDNTCETQLEITDLEFDGGIFGSILNTVEDAFRFILESLLEEEICKQFEGFPANVVLLLNKALEQYINLPPSDPLSRQSSFLPEPDADLVDFYNMSDAFGGVIGNMLTAANEYLSYPVNETNEESDLGINELIRSKLLDEDGVFRLDLNAAIVNNSDVGVNITVILSTMHLVGLDTFQKFGPVRAISSQTAELKFLLESLDITMDLQVEVQELSKINSLLSSTSGITEEITVKTSLSEINATIAAFFALDKNTIRDVTLGSIFNTTQILPCLFSYLATPANVTQLWMEVETIKPPIFDSFLSAGAEEFINNATSISFEIYDEAIVNSLPGLFDTTLRQSINDVLAKVICPPYEAQVLDGFVDFRDLLLNSSLAIAAGASGSEPYGDLMYILMDLVDEFLVDPNTDDGIPLINENLIQSVTKAQSNESGTLIFPGNLFNATDGNTGATSFEVRAFDGA